MSRPSPWAKSKRQLLIIDCVVSTRSRKVVCSCCLICEAKFSLSAEPPTGFGVDDWVAFEFFGNLIKVVYSVVFLYCCISLWLLFFNDDGLCASSDNWIVVLVLLWWRCIISDVDSFSNWSDSVCLTTRGNQSYISSRNESKVNLRERSGWICILDEILPLGFVIKRRRCRCL